MGEREAHRKIEMVIMDRIINRLIYLWVAMNVLVYLMQQERSHIAGFEWVDMTQTLLMLAVSALAIFKNQVPVKVKGFIVAFVTVCLSYLGIYKYGLVAAGFVIVPMSGMIFAMYFDAKKFAAFFFFNTVFLAVLGWAYVSGQLPLRFDVSALVVNSGHWMIYLCSSFVAVFFIGYSILEYKRELNKLLNQLISEQKKIEKLAYFDQLTGLRRISQIEKQSAISQIAEKSGDTAVLFIDIDDFKQINDQYGHEAGDECLKYLAQVIQDNIRSNDRAYRIGGDEMIVVINAINGEKVAMSLAERMVMGVQEGFVYDDETICFSISVGVALSDGMETEFTQIRRKADEAMYQAKRDDSRHIVLFADQKKRRNLKIH